MKYRLRRTHAFEKDYARAKKHNLPLEKLKSVIEKLANGIKLSPSNHDHQLTGNWEGHRECHITPNWLLIYRIFEDVLVLELTRTGSHSDLFNE